MKRRLNKGMKEQKEMTNTKNTETIKKKKQKSIIKDIGTWRKAKKRNLNKARNNMMKRTNSNIHAQANQQLRESEICNCQNKGGEFRLTRHNKTRKNVNNAKKKDEQ